MSQGVYVLANDVTSEWLEACLRSLRHHEPDLPVLVLPFDDRIEATSAIAARHGAGVWRHESLPELDRLGATLTDRYVEIRYFRKLATFWGPFESFVYLDADNVTLGPYLGEWLRALAGSDADFLYYNSDVEQAFRPGALRDRMIAAGSRAFNAGFFVARGGLLDLGTVRAALAEAPALLPELTWNVEQGVFNWLAVRQGWRVRALLELLPRFAPVSWFRCRIERRGDRYVQPWEGEERAAAILHWAGVSLPFAEHQEIFLRFRLLGEPWWRRAAYRMRWRFRLAAKRRRERRAA